MNMNFGYFFAQWSLAADIGLKPLIRHCRRIRTVTIAVIAIAADPRPRRAGIFTARRSRRRHDIKQLRILLANHWPRIILIAD